MIDEPPEAVAPPNGGPPDDSGWLRNKAGREYVPAEHRQGVIFRQGEETVGEARERDQRPRDKRPKGKQSKPKRPPMPGRPPKVDLQELEKVLAEAFQAPAIVCASMGDEWAANHFTARGPYLARNLVLASQHNPWLRRKLEEAATGGDAAMKLISLVGVGGALVMYIVPVAVYYFPQLPMSDKGRIMLEIPDRRANAPGPPPTSQPDSTQPEPVPAPTA